MNPTSKKFISLFLAFSLMAISCASLRTTGGKREKHGAKLIVTKKDGQQIKGELITVKPNSLLLLDTEGKDVSIDIANIKVITIVKKSKILKGTGIGLLIGGSIGAGIGALVGYAKGDDPGAGARWGAASAGTKALFDAIGGVVIGGLIGVILGGIAGALLGTDKTIQIEGMTDSEIQEAMEKLRKKARIRDYK